jgi:hypothetical protein
MQGLYFENCLWTAVEMNCIRYFLLGRSFLKYFEAF